MIDDTKTVSVTYMLNTALKELVFNNESYFPLYARINFLSNNTKVSITSRAGKRIYMSERIFETFVEMAQSDKGEQTILWRKRPYSDILDKEELIKKSILKEFQEQKDRFSFGSFVANYRWYEKDIWFVLRSYALQEIRTFSSTLMDYSEFEAFDFEELPIVDHSFRYWSSNVLKEGTVVVPEHLRTTLETLIILTCYVGAQSQSPKNMEHGLRKPTEKGFIFSWTIGDERESFKSYLKSITKEVLMNGHPRSYFCLSFLKEFIPSMTGSSRRYVEVIDKLTEVHKIA